MSQATRFHAVSLDPGVKLGGKSVKYLLRPGRLWRGPPPDDLKWCLPHAESLRMSRTAHRSSIIHNFDRFLGHRMMGPSLDCHGHHGNVWGTDNNKPIYYVFSVGIPPFITSTSQMLSGRRYCYTTGQNTREVASFQAAA